MSKPSFMESSTYDLIRRRLNQQADDLRQRLDRLNQVRKDTFGAVETQLVATDRITTANNCIPRDMVALGNQFLFGYNVHVGLRSEVKLQDVFSVYRFESSDHTFHEEPANLLDDPQFSEDFQNLYKYYKDTVFARFAIRGPHLFMVFQVGKSSTDIKTFKWALQASGIQYLGNRFDHEFSYPRQHEFSWQKVSRDQHRRGSHPHVSILDRVFVETIGGDLTVKIEDNTDSGLGIYAEPVDYPDQTLDDADYQYADLGNIILLKIRPYQEKETRYFIFNEKLQEVLRVDSLAQSCILLPDEQGIIFSNGFYLQTGENKLFDQQHDGLTFERKILSPNGEDFLYVFYHPASGHQVLLPYNLVNMDVQSPIHCGGFTVFPNGELCYFRTEEQPGRHHVIQIWQTPFGTSLPEVEQTADSWLAKVGNKDLVRGMAECKELLTLLQKDDNYADLYVDLVKKTGDILDSYYWIGKTEAANLSEPLKAIRQTATSAIDEYEKVRSIRDNTNQQMADAVAATQDLFGLMRRKKPARIMDFVKYLAELRSLRGRILGLRELRYVDEDQVGEMEVKVAEKMEELGQNTVSFLLREEALQPYAEEVTLISQSITEIGKVSEAKEVEERLDSTGHQLELLIDIVGNLQIDDATQTTSIIERVTGIFGRLNGLRASLKKRRRELAGTEAKAEFIAQVNLLDQGLTNYLELSDTPEKAEDYLTRLMVQVEELEGRFVEFEEFTLQLSEKREDIYNAFETRRVQLVESRSRKANAQYEAAGRILTGIRNRVNRIQEIEEINAYFAADLMVEKVRNIINSLQELGDAVKAGDVQTRLKAAKEEAVRQLKDRQELFVDGENIIRLGRHAFSVNRQLPDLTIVPQGEGMALHITGTDFFVPIDAPEFEETRPVWDMTVISENSQVYRSEYLAWKFLAARPDLHNQKLGEAVQSFMATRYSEGYTKGVHDQDATRLLEVIIRMESDLGLLRFDLKARMLARLCWDSWWDEETKLRLRNRIRSAAAVWEAFSGASLPEDVLREIQTQMDRPLAELGWEKLDSREAAVYLMEEISRHDDFVVSGAAYDMAEDFLKTLKRNKQEASFRQSIDLAGENPRSKWIIAKEWVRAFREQADVAEDEVETEAAVLLLGGKLLKKRVRRISSASAIEGLQGEHPLISNGSMDFDYHVFQRKMRHFDREVEPLFQAMSRLKHELIERERKLLRPEEFQPQVMSSFVRNQLIDKVYLPIIGDNLAKQLGTEGDTTRTDRQGMLLLISPPGYGKTTLMEYIANRLGLIFMKINGPAIGHQVTSLDPAEAPNASAAVELNRLNLALEMGNNVMLYLDDIQHCHPEFLQKFISLTDAQRKIEGVFRGNSNTYDLRGKKFAVVMAGNPYTESGEKFRIPDMLANRADTYNLGDMISVNERLFVMSYLENALSAHPIVARLTQIGSKDALNVIQAAEQENTEGIELESNISREELSEIQAVLRHMIRIRNLVLQVNQTYIQSAGQQDEYRTEPPFLLQGSYRNMSRLTEKLSPIMNDAELDQLILSHYESEAQTLTNGAEANFLRLKALMDASTRADQQRLSEIKDMYLENKRLSTDRLGQIVEEMRQFSGGLDAIRRALESVGREENNPET